MIIYISCNLSISNKAGQIKQQKSMIIRLMWNAQTNVIIPKIPATASALYGYPNQVVLTISKHYVQNHATRVKMVGWIRCLLMLIRVVANKTIVSPTIQTNYL